MQGLCRYGIIIARIMVAIVFLLNATGVIDQAEAARELAERGAPSHLVPFLMIVGRSVELIGGLALLSGISPAGGRPRSIRIPHSRDVSWARILVRNRHARPTSDSSLTF